jgi:hypothetical protein
MYYSKLGTSCKPQTIACTSNQKFLSPCDPIYSYQTTYMLKYPAANINEEELLHQINTSDEKNLTLYPEDTLSRPTKNADDPIPMLLPGQNKSPRAIKYTTIYNKINNSLYNPTHPPQTPGEIIKYIGPNTQLIFKD